MKQHILNQKGSSHIVLVLAVVVLAVVGFAGYRVLQNSSSNSSSSGSTLSTKSTAPKTINSANDVRKASRSLDDESVDGQVNPGKLDSDLNALL